ncbi:hypothetical protein D1007_59862 [Hordeum vulgare]|nr:hypothetical protein D1007_59862 [Hordeum vulgare]KAI4973088.1 hypothetical protein ZWY2020_028796 [Hordeum vulgare]
MALAVVAAGPRPGGHTRVGYFEEHVANCINEVVPPNDSAWDGLGDNGDDKVEVLRRIVHRRSSASVVRPWKGPLPKVGLPALTLADFLYTWKKVPIRRKNNRTAASSRPLAAALVDRDPRIREVRESRLNKFLRRDELTSDVGHVPAGYMAQLRTNDCPTVPSTMSYDRGSAAESEIESIATYTEIKKPIARVSGDL